MIFVLTRALPIAGLCKGSTTDSDSVCEGSNPSPAAMKKPQDRLVLRFFVYKQPVQYNVRVSFEFGQCRGESLTIFDALINAVRISVICWIRRLSALLMVPPAEVAT